MYCHPWEADHARHNHVNGTTTTREQPDRIRLRDNMSLTHRSELPSPRNLMEVFGIGRTKAVNV